MKIYLEISLFFFLASVSNSQDGKHIANILLKDGSIYKGVIRMQDDNEITIKSQSRSLSFPISDLLLIDYGLATLARARIDSLVSELQEISKKDNNNDLSPPTSTIAKSEKINDSSNVKFIPYDVPPVPLSPIQPKYPTYAKMAGIEGTVVLQVFVDDRGRVKDTVIIKGIPNTGLDKSAVMAVRSVRFRPAKQRERAVGTWISIPVKFELED